MSNKKEWISLKVISYTVTGIFFALLIPLFWIGIYNFPSADDFSVGMAASRVWQQNHSVFETIIEAFRETGKLYMGWTGTFSTVFMMALCPAVFGKEMYVIVPFLMIVLLSFSMWYFIHTILRVKLHANKYLTNIIAMIIMLFTIQGMPSAVEGFYWYTGAVHYIFPFSFLLLFLSVLLKEKPNSTFRQKFTKIVILSLLGIFIGGGNFMTALILMIICSFIVCKWIVCKEVEKRIYLIPILLSIIAFFVNVLAPGNSVRQDVASGFGPIRAIYMSFYYCFHAVWNFTLCWKTVCFVLLLLPFVWMFVKSTNLSFKYPVLVIIVSICLMSALFTPCLYGVGNVDAGRLQDTIYIAFVILLVTNLIYILGWVSKKMIHTSSEESIITSKYYMLFFAGATFLTIVISIIFIHKDPNYYVTASAMHSLTSGQAAKYGEETQERLVQLLDQQQKDIAFHPFTNPPYVLFFGDITDNVDDWTNKAICQFYKKDSAILLKE